MKSAASNELSKKKKPETQQPVVQQDLGKPKRPKWEGWVILLTSIIYYINTVANGHALDDVVVITMNAYTKSGFTGLHGILANDSLRGFIGGDNPLAGGRYRPLSLITFAIEWQLFGDNPAIAHFINVSLYAFTGWFLWFFLKKFIFIEKPIIAFIAAMLFIIHPVHTEVVANIKSRDEILSLLGSMGALYYLFKFTDENHKAKYVIFSSLCFFLGLFAKENTIMYLFIFPLALFCFSKANFQNNLKFLIPHLLLAIIFMVIRASIISSPHHVSSEILNDPYLRATFIQKYSTIFVTLLFYIKLLFYPYPLSHDYTYNQIPLTGFTDWRVLLSLAIYTTIFLWAIFNIRKKSVIAFGILYFLITLFITSNLIFNIGAPMGERFLYMPSVGFCMIIAVSGYRGYEWFLEKIGKNASIAIGSGLSAILLIACGGETVARNMNWANDINLYTHDVNIVPNSAEALKRAGTSYIFISDSVMHGHVDSIPDKTKWKSYLKIADTYFEKALKIYPQYGDVYLDMGCSKLRQYKFKEAQTAWDSAEKYTPTSPLLIQYRNNLGRIYLDSANSWHNKGNLDESFRYLEKALILIPEDPEVYYNFGGYYYTVHDFAKARENWQKCLELNPDHEQAKKGLKAIEGS